MEIKKVYAIDLAIVVGTVIGILFIIGYARPLVIAPIDKMESSNSSVLFSFERADTILIDDNKEFSSPLTIYVKDNLIVTLKPGKYYWKVVGVLQSEVHELTMNSEVALRLRADGNESYSVVNAGNVNLNVGVYDNGGYVKNITLDVDEASSTDGNKFVGREND
jgi:hypothetical protein